MPCSCFFVANLWHGSMNGFFILFHSFHTRSHGLPKDSLSSQWTQGCGMYGFTQIQTASNDRKKGLMSWVPLLALFLWKRYWGKIWALGNSSEIQGKRELEMNERSQVSVQSPWVYFAMGESCEWVNGPVRWVGVLGDCGRWGEGISLTR